MTAEEKITKAYTRARRAIDDLERLGYSNDVDVTYMVTDLSRNLKLVVEKTYNKQRAKLWDKFGPGKHATPGGRAFSFAKPPATKRKTDLTLLKRKYPKVYGEVVSETPTKADTAGTLKLNISPRS